MKNKIKLRAIISLLLAVLLFIIAATGVYLMLNEQGKIKDFVESWRMIHVFSAIGMTILVMIHLTFNFKMLMQETKKLIKG